MKLNRYILVTAAIILFIDGSSAISYEGCVFNDGTSCDQCYKRQVTFPKASCGALNKDHCLLSRYDKGQGKAFCTQCEVGYTLVTTKVGTAVKQTCVKDKTIPKCLSVHKYLSYPPLCEICEDGYYSVLSLNPLKTTCTPAAEVRGAIENCSQGGMARGGQAKCHKCKDGFARDAMGEACSKPNIPGCLINPFTNSYKCLACDYFNGYFMTPGNTCVKQ